MRPLPLAVLLAVAPTGAAEASCTGPARLFAEIDRMFDLGAVAAGAPHVLHVELTTERGDVAIEQLTIDPLDPAFPADGLLTLTAWLALHPDAALPEGAVAQDRVLAGQLPGLTIPDGTPVAFPFVVDALAGPVQGRLTWSTSRPGVVAVQDVRVRALAPDVTVSRRWVDFGAVPVGSSGVATLQVKNLKGVATTLTITSDDDQLAPTVAATPLPGLASAPVFLEFQPRLEGPQHGELTVDANGVTVARIGWAVNDCEGGLPAAHDLDGDGWSPCAGDTDDDDAAVHPDGAPPSYVGTVVHDDDDDGVTEVEGDCDDGDPSVWPGAVDQANGVDDDCDGAVDEGADDPDGDGFTAADGDCGPLLPWTYPGAYDAADGADNDCDGAVDEDAVADDTEVVPATDGCGRPVETCDDTACSTSGRPDRLGVLGLPLLVALRRRRR